jgi:site-specific recombinase XerC
MATRLGDRTINVRDRALLLVAFAWALRRSEVSALNVDDVEVTANGLESSCAPIEHCNAMSGFA